MRGITLRPYQKRTEDNAGEFIYNSPHKRGLSIAPTGSGKAISTATISKLTNDKCLVVQPSYELLMQNLEKARLISLDPSVFSASAGKKEISDLTYATPLSIVNYPELFKDFNFVIIDEAHENMSKGLKGGKVDTKSKFIEFLDQINPKKVIGLTATPIQLTQSRAGAELKMVNRSMRSYWYQADIFDVTQISEICDKYWAELNYKPIGFNSKGLRLNSTGNDFTQQSIIQNYKLNNNNHKILEQHDQLLSDGSKSILTFVPSVNEGHELKKLNKDFEFIFDKTPKKEREAIIKAFKRGDIPNLLNCSVLTCLSKDTEVLTKRGWLGMEDVELTDDIAQYENGNIYFGKAIAKHTHIHKNEMVTVKSSNMNFKVTDDHDMLVKKYYSDRYFKKVKAREIVGKKVVVPVSGYYYPDNIEIPQKKFETSKNRFINYNSYNYRKKGNSWQEAYDKAEKLYNERLNQKYKNPNELTLDECRFIGFYLGDGSRTYNKYSGGMRYSLAQSAKYPKMIEWIENILKSCDINYNRSFTKKEKIEKICGQNCWISSHYSYNLSMGTGGDGQKVKGLYHLIPYLEKRGTEYLKYLNREQYFALMEGLFKADGTHGNSIDYKGQPIVGEYKELFDMLQEIGVCRGYKVSIRSKKKRQYNIKQLYTISLKDKQQHQITNSRAFLEKSNNEKVWCLTVEKGTLVTRYKGNVIIMGNTGFDHPHLDSIIIGRETNSFGVYAQIIGRVVRPIITPDGSIFKKKGTIIDLTGNYKRFGSVENITFEKQEYTKGWAMWNGDKIMTGYPFENWDMPTREEVKKVYNKSLVKGKKPEEIKFPFGKHKGKDLANIFKIDRGYLKWLLTNKEFEWETANMKQLKKEIENLFKKEILN